MAEDITSAQHPFVALLPPTTDPATYLTLLEYNLTKDNLPILNSLLAASDNTLAIDIGWDLAGLVLPLVDQGIQEAQQCMLTVAQKGNPREVILSVAAELENISHGITDSDHESEAYGDDEAMNEAEQPPTDPTNRCICLITMLRHLHPRIQTKYPSRFLATTLPALVSAYRALSHSASVLQSIVALLNSLSGKQKPVLPPRRSSQSATESTSPATRLPNSTGVSMPDPEAAYDGHGATYQVSEIQKNMSQRLLQASLSEIVETFLDTIYRDGIPDPEKQYLRDFSYIFQGSSAAGVQDLVLRNKRLVAFSSFEQCAKLLDLNIAQALGEKVEGMEKAAKDIEHDVATADAGFEITEYPTSTSQIDLSLRGLIALYAMEIMTLEPAMRHPDLRFAARLMIATSHPDFVTANTEPLSVIALAGCLTVLVEAFHGRWEEWVELPKPIFLSLMEALAQIFKTNFDASIRKVAHETATHMLHEYPNLTTRLDIVKNMCKNEKLDTVATTEIFRPPVVTTGAIKAVGITWLKEEFIILIDKSDPRATTTATQGHRTLPPPLSNSAEGLPVALLIDDTVGLYDLVVPRLDTQFLLVAPNDLTKNETASTQLDTFLENATMCVRCLNLLHVLVARSGLGTASQELKDVVGSILEKPQTLEFSSTLSSCVGWVLEGMKTQHLFLSDAQRMDVWSLEDAVTRVNETIRQRQAVITQN